MLLTGNNFKFSKTGFIHLVWTALLLTCITGSYAQRTPSIGGVQTFNSSATSNARVVRLDESHVLVVYKDGSTSTSSDMYARVGEVDTSTQSISWGTASLIESGSYARHSLVRMSDTKVVVFYEIDLTNDLGYARVLDMNLSTDVISSVGSAQTWHGGDVDAAGSHVVQHAVPLSSSTFAIVFADDESTDDGKVKIGTVSGSSISFGSDNTFSTGDVQHLYMSALGSDKLVISYEDDGTSNDPGQVIVGSVSGTSVSFGTPVTFHSGSASAVAWTANAAISSTQFVVAYMEDDNSDYGAAKVGTVSGTSITLSSSQYFFESTDRARDITMDTVTGDEFLIGWNGGGGYDTRLVLGEVSGSGASASIAYSSSVQVLTDEGDDSWITRLNDNAFVMAYVDETNVDDHGEAVVGTITPPISTCSMTASMTAQTNVDCNGNNTGAMTVTESSGMANFSYSWSNGATTSNTSSTTNTISSLAAGTYTVTVTDNNSCTAVASATITQPSALVASASVSSTLDCNGDTDGQVLASGTGGTTTYTYSWNTGGTSATETNLGAGTYSVTVTDQNGCTDSASVTLTQPTALVASASVSSTLDCNGDTDGQVLASGTGGTTTYTYSWNTGGTSATETNLGAGTYSVTVTDQNGCTDSASVTLTQPTALNASSSVSSALDCNGDTDGQILASGTGGTGSYTYSWNTGGTSATETNLGAGTYSVTVTDQNGCTDSSTVTLNQPTALVASATVSSALDCNGYTDGQVLASGTGGTGSYTYSWNTGETSATETNLGAGTYSVTVTDQNGCTDSASVTLTEPVTLVASASVSSTLDCNGDTDGQVLASGTGGTTTYTYSWNTGGTSATETNLGAGTYSVTVTDQNGCTDSASVTLTQPTALVASASVSSTLDCNGDTDGQVLASGTGGTTTYTYSWNTGGTSATETNLGAGTYSVTVTDQNGCTDSASVTLTQPTALNASSSVSSALDCNGDTDGQILASGTSGTGSYTYSWNTGGTSATETNLGAGTYSVTVTDQNGCTDSSTVTLNQPTALVASATVSSALDCNGYTDGQVLASGTGGTGSYTYSWNTGETSATETNLGAGTYSVTVTDQNGCTDSASVTLTEPATLVASASVSSTLDCNGDTDGQVLASGTGGTTTYTYSWNTGGTSATETNLGAGTYSVTVTDQNGCTDSASVTLTQPTALVASASLDNNVSCNGDSDGGATASGTGGTGSYTYSWSNGATSATETGLGAGTYSVTVTDQNGCTDSASVTITEPTAISISINADSNVSCNGGSDGGLTASPSGGAGSYTYLWSNGATTASITSLVAGTYTVTVTDGSGCTNSNSETVTEPTALSSTVLVDSNVSCNSANDGGLTASPSGGTTTYTYLWSNSATTASLTGIAPGTYTVTVTDANGCTTTASGTVTEPTALSASVAVDDTVSCNGGSDGGLTASASGGTTSYTFAWSNSATTAAITSIPAGTYTVTVTDANGCTTTAFNSVTEPTALVANAMVDSLSAVSANPTGGTPSYTYVWSNGSTQQSQTALAPGTYTVTVTDANNCTDDGSVVIPNPTGFTYTPTAGCNPLTVSFQDTSSNVVSRHWDFGNGDTSNLANPTVIYDGVGSYSVTLINTYSYGLTDTVEVSNAITVNPPKAAFNANPVAGCTTPHTVFFTDQSTLPDVWNWNFGDAGTSTAQNPIHTYTTSGTFTVRLIVLDTIFGCADTAYDTVIVSTLSASVSIDSNVSCNGFADGGVSVSVSNNIGTPTYVWSTTETTSTITGLTAGTYSVTAVDVNGCTATASNSVTEPAALSASVSVDSNETCSGANNGGLTASASGGTTSYTYLWSNSATTAAITGIASGTYTVTVTDANGCTSTASGTVGISSSFAVSVVIDSNVNCNGGADGGVSANPSSGATPYSYSWSNTATTVSLTGLTAGAYSVTVVDNDGCSVTASNSVTEPTVLDASISVSSNVSCNSGSDGALTASGSGGTASYTYSWNTGGTTAAITGLSAGTYSVTVTDANGCTDSTSAIVTEPVVLSLSANVDSNVSCNGGSDGALTATPAGGTASYTYSWNTGGTNAAITGLAAGTYSVTVTDANGCTDSASATVTEPTVLATSVSVDSNVSCNGGNDGGLSATPSGGTAAYTYTWSNAATSASITGIAAGTYTVTVTDAHGCTTTSSGTVTEPTALSASVSLDSNETCSGANNGGLTASASGGTTGYTYSWSNSATTASITGISAGTYTITVTDANGCTTTASGTVGIVSSFAVTVTLDSVVSCNSGADGGVTANPTSGATPYTYAWSNSATTAALTGLTADTYVVTVTDDDGCQVSDSNTVTEPTALALSIAVDNNVSCNGNSDGGLTASASGGTAGYTFSWSNSATTATISGLTAGTYSVTVTDANGCTITASESITEPNALVATAATTANVSCNGFDDGSVMASASGGTASYTFLWSTGNTTAAVSNLAPGTYTVTITDANGCTSSDATDITEPAVLSVSTTLDSNANCHASNDGGASSTVTGGTTNYSYVWSNSANTAAIIGVPQGTYTLTVTDANGCTDTSIVFIDAIDDVDPIAVSQDITVYLDANGQASITVAQIDNGSSDNCGIDTMYIDITDFDCGDVGSNNVELTVMDSTNNTATSTAVVTVSDTVSPLLAGCPGNMTVAASASCDYELPDFTTGITYSDSCGVQSVVQTPSAGSFIGTGITGVSIVVTDVNSNTTSCSFDITVNDSTAPSITCPGDINTVNDAGVCGAVVTFSDPVVMDNCGIDTVLQINGLPSGALFPTDTTLMTFVAVDSSGNTDTCSFNVIVEDVELPTIACPNDTTICESTFAYTTPAGADNCGVLSVQQTAGLPSGSVFPVGSTVNTFVVTDSAGNQDSCSFTVTRDEVPSNAQAGTDQTLCDTVMADLSATAPAVGTGAWTSLGSATVTNAGQAATTADDLVIGLNSFVWTVSNGVCPAKADTVVVQIDETPTVADAGSDDDICDVTEYTLEANDPSVGVGLWTTGSTALIADSASAETDVTGMPQGVSTFTWTITNGVCPASSASVSIEVGTTPIVNAGDDLYTQGVADVPVTVTSDQPVTWSWQPATLVDDATADSTTAFITQTEELIVSGINSAECIAYDTVMIRVLTELEVNTAFTPDGDNINDEWDIEGSEYYPQMKVTVFNRWGAIVFESDEGYRTKFDGRYNGKLLPVSSYYYIIEFNDGVTEPRDGNLTIIY